MSAEHPTLNQAIDRELNVWPPNDGLPADVILARIRNACSSFSPSDLRTAIEVHRTNCHHPRCLVLSAMETIAKETP